MDSKYDPSIQALLSQVQSDWGKPDENRVNLLPYGIKPLDLALYGMDTINGELVLIQGPEKQRKTTMVVNVICNYMTSKLPEEKPFTVIDTLESGMNPKRYRDTLIANMATRVLLGYGHRYKENCPVCKSPVCTQIGLSPEFLRFNTRTDQQQDAINDAIILMQNWPLYVYGASPTQGDTRNLEYSLKGDGKKESRWEWLVKEHNAKVFVTDHLQQYSFQNVTGDYEKQLLTISAVSDIVARYGIVCLMISQVSLTSQREAAAGMGKLTASGGRKGAAEATTIISVNYESGSGTLLITLEDSRKASSFSIWQPLEDVSGAFFGVPNRGTKVQFRPGMQEVKTSDNPRNN